jgi:hypothetical protein
MNYYQPSLNKPQPVSTTVSLNFILIFLGRVLQFKTTVSRP